MGEYVIEAHAGCDRRIAELEAEIEWLRAALAKIGEDRAWLHPAEFARHVLADEGKP
jgi:uncharacterized small protein (DUF1192 family)